MNVYFKDVESGDVGRLVTLMREYYSFDRIPFNEHTALGRLGEFVADPALGKAWLIEGDDRVLMGYIVITTGYGLEHGRNATIDEFYLREAFRAKGIGGNAIRFVERELRSRGIVSVHTEVERDNIGAQEFWRRHGFHAFDRYPMVKMLDT